jgi:hypothetical protein
MDFSFSDHRTALKMPSFLYRVIFSYFPNLEQSISPDTIFG